MTKIRSILLFALIVVTFAACRNDGNNQRVSDGQDEAAAQDARLAPGEYRTDEPDDLTAYFQTLCSEWGAVVAVHSNDPQDSLEIWNAIRLLDDYAAGRREFYPADEVRGALDALAFDLGYWFNHGSEVDTDRAEIFFFRFLEQAVRLSPQVDFVTDFHCADGTAGILNYHEWSPNPLYSFLVYPTANGLRISKIGETGDTKIEKIFCLSDDAGNDYYLCSNNGTVDGSDFTYGIAFRQFLFMRDGDNLDLVAAYTGPDFTPDWIEGKIVFNPRLLQWDCCTQKGNTFIRIENSRSLRLILDGKQSRFANS